MAADLYLKEIDALRFELSMNHASEEVWRMARDVASAHAAAHAHEDVSALGAAVKEGDGLLGETPTAGDVAASLFRVSIRHA